MKVLVSGCTASVAKFAAERPDRVGVLLTPSNGNAEWWGPDMTWACDNDCFGGLNAPNYLRMLARVMGFKTRPQWVTCPDVVGDMQATWSRWFHWYPVVRTQLGLPVALVLQDGLETLKGRGPWGQALGLELDAVFVGGSTAWKLGDAAARYTLLAHERGKLVHWGRVNTERRIRYLGRGMRAGRLWCDTFDGTGFTRFGEARIPLAIRWIDEAMACRQQVMFGGTA